MLLGALVDYLSNKKSFWRKLFNHELIIFALSFIKSVLLALNSFFSLTGSFERLLNPATGQLSNSLDFLLSQQYPTANAWHYSLFYLHWYNRNRANQDNFRPRLSADSMIGLLKKFVSAVVSI